MKKTIIPKEYTKPENWILISENKPTEVDKLFELYSEDKGKARIYYHLNKGKFQVTRKVIFEFTKGEFKVSVIRRTYGISITSKIYSSEKTIESVIYRNKKFYYSNAVGNRSYCRLLTYNLLTLFCDQYSCMGIDKVTMDYFTNKFGWLRNVKESGYVGITLNRIVSKKLFNEKAILRSVYNCPYPVAKMIHNHTLSSFGNFHKVWPQMRKQLINIENLSETLFNDGLFNDTCKMAEMVGKKVNCSWSPKRLKTEHDEWSKTVTQVLIESEPLHLLKIRDIYKDFSEFSKYDLLLTNRELLEEGRRMGHCVGTYSPSVDNGYCAIYRVFGGTLELRLKTIHLKDVNTGALYPTNTLIIGQYMNLGNVPVTGETLNKVRIMVDEFNKQIETQDKKYLRVEEQLPF